MPDGNPVEYVYFGTYENFEARPLLDAFVAGPVRFVVDVDASRLPVSPPVTDAPRHRDGRGFGLSVGVLAEDLDLAVEIQQRVFKIQV